MSAEDRLKELGIELPTPGPAAGLYSHCVQTGNLLFVSGQIPVVGGQVSRTGHCGENITLEEGADLARVCAINALAQVRAYLGSLDKVARVVRLAGYVASAPGFVEHPRVMNGASQLVLDVFGEAGEHTRAAIGVAELPMGVPVEVEFLFEVS
ncbi:MAG TPA: RidA family protein [Dehalococcoidia bacterium]|nr:RidA family protein [Dehalococcoidia bacterium]